jgi:hypothetical protein
MTGTAERESARAQDRLAESVVEQAKKLSLRINVERFLPMALCALVCLLAYGSLSMWAGFRMGSGQAASLPFMLNMPSGLLMGGLFLAGGLLTGFYAAREFAESGKGWKKGMALALVMLVAGGALLGLAIWQSG